VLRAQAERFIAQRGGWNGSNPGQIESGIQHVILKDEPHQNFADLCMQLPESRGQFGGVIGRIFLDAGQCKCKSCRAILGRYFSSQFQGGVLQSSDEFIAGEVVQHHLHARDGLLKRCERWWQYLHRGNMDVADMQLAVFAASKRADFFWRFAILRMLQAR
jgi:hypothetical protein